MDIRANRIAAQRGKAPGWFYAQSDDDQIEMLAFDQYREDFILTMLDSITDGKIKLWDPAVYFHLRLALIGV